MTKYEKELSDKRDEIVRAAMDGQFQTADDILATIIATARADALRETAERAIAWSHEPYPEDTDLTPQGISRYLDEGLRSAILADKQEDK
jgi:hypothetical protein